MSFHAERWHGRWWLVERHAGRGRLVKFYWLKSRALGAASLLNNRDLIEETGPWSAWLKMRKRWGIR